MLSFHKLYFLLENQMTDWRTIAQKVFDEPNRWSEILNIAADAALDANDKDSILLRSFAKSDGDFTSVYILAKKTNDELILNGLQKMTKRNIRPHWVKNGGGYYTLVDPGILAWMIRYLAREPGAETEENKPESYVGFKTEAEAVIRMALLLALETD